VKPVVAKSAVSSAATCDIIVATPSALAEISRKSDTKHFEKVEFIVVDEADLVLSYGYDAETREAVKAIPSTAQSMLVSATLGEDVDKLRKVVLRKPVVVKITLDEGDNDSAALLTHNYTMLKSVTDKYLVTYALLKLRVLTGKTLIFTHDIDVAFRLKIFLDKFGIRSATLNAELPHNSRVHCVEQFNAGVFDVLIACDEHPSTTQRKNKKTGSKAEKQRQIPGGSEFGLARGIDFFEVSTVLNFDLPPDATSYTHRAGRTARAGRRGVALTLVCSESEKTRLQMMCKSLGLKPEKLVFQVNQVEAFRYRVEDSLRGITSAVVLDARLKDVKREMFASEKLQDYFDDNPKDLEALKHDKALTSRMQPHLADVPAYLLPPALRQRITSTSVRSSYRKKHRRVQRSKGDPLDTVGSKRFGRHSKGMSTNKRARKAV